MALKVAERGAVEPFRAMEVMKAANALDAAAADPAGRVVHLEIGEPGGHAPAPVLAAARAALGDLRIGYTEALGVPALRARIARHYADAYGLEVPVERIAITAGSSGGFILSFLAAFEAGDRIGMVEPAYPAYRNIIKAMGLTPVLLPGDPADGFRATPAAFEASPVPLDGILIASPNNPTGTMLDAEQLAALDAWCHDRGIRLISDEIYHGIGYEAPAVSILGCAHGADTVVVNSFSKYFRMTGWRLGWLVLPDDLVRPVERLAQNLFISPPALAQHAGIGAFDATAEMDAAVDVYRRNRQILLDLLPRLGVRWIAPADGAFYVYADVSPLTDDSADLARRWLTEAGVAATPGIDFDTRRGARYIRFSTCGPTEDLVRAADRLTAWAQAQNAECRP